MYVYYIYQFEKFKVVAVKYRLRIRVCPNDRHYTVCNYFQDLFPAFKFHTDLLSHRVDQFNGYAIENSGLTIALGTISTVQTETTYEQLSSRPAPQSPVTILTPLYVGFQSTLVSM